MEAGSNMSKDNMKDSSAMHAPPTPECQEMEAAIEGIRKMFVDKVQHDHIVNNRQTPARRAAFIKQHGSAYGIFQVNNNLPAQYQVGIFKPGASYKAWLRYSSDTPHTLPDKNTTVGIGIKLFGVAGHKALEEDVNATTLDFILQNTQVFFAADAIEMCEFKAAALNGTLDEWLKTHPETARILAEMGSRTVKSVLTEPLWSCVPFKFGDYDYCKYKLAVQSVADPIRTVDINAPGYLGRDMQERLIQQEARLDFYVQLRNNPHKQSITSARSLWEEEEAVPVKVATLIIPQQNIMARGQADYGESLSYNIWRTLPEMAPVGSIAEARKVVYRSSAQVRRNVNGQTIGEPTEPRPSSAPVPPYNPSLEVPWPSGTVGDVIEDFQSFGEYEIRPGFYYTYGPLTISARDMMHSVWITKAQQDVAGVVDGMVIQYINEEGRPVPGEDGEVEHRVQILRILLEKIPAERIRFGLSMKSNSNDATLKITAYQRDKEDEKKNKLVADPVIVSQGNAVIYLEANKDEKIDLLTLKFTEETESFELDNFVVTYAAEKTTDYPLWQANKLYHYGDRVSWKNKNWQLISSANQGWESGAPGSSHFWAEI